MNLTDITCNHGNYPTGIKRDIAFSNTIRRGPVCDFCNSVRQIPFFFFELKCRKCDISSVAGLWFWILHEGICQNPLHASGKRTPWVLLFFLIFSSNVFSLSSVMRYGKSRWNWTEVKINLLAYNEILWNSICFISVGHFDSHNMVIYTLHLHRYLTNELMKNK